MITSLIPYITLDFPTVGGASGILVALGWVAREIIQWTSRRKDQQITATGQSVSAVSAAVTDAATANTVLLETTKAVHTENVRLNGVIIMQAAQLTEKDRRINELQAEISTLMEKLGSVYDQLDELKSR